MPGEDELAYSLASRWAQAVVVPNDDHARRKLFGDSPAHVSATLTGNLDRFASLVPNRILDAERLVQKHTLFPYYLPFLQPDVAERLHGMLLQGWEPKPQVWLHTMRATVPTVPYLAFCPDCVKDDLRKVGEPTWRRAHQLPGVEVCHRHGIRLRLGPWERGHTRVFRIPPRNADIYPEVPRRLPDGIALAFARESARLLDGDVAFTDHVALHAGMATVIAARGFVRSGRIARRRLEAHIREAIGDAALVAFGMSTVTSRSPGSLHAVHEHRSPGYSPPCRYLLMLAILGATVDELVLAARKPRPTIAAPTRQTRPPVRINEARLLVCRERILAALAANPGWSRLDLFNNERSAYGDTVRYDKEWWEQHAPPRRATGTRIDWQQRDADASIRIEDALRRLRGTMPRTGKLSGVMVLRAAALPTDFRPDPRRMPRTLGLLASAARWPTSRIVAGVSR
ncbi:MAG: hypothetical protein DI532_20620 [Azospirillum brasilense]|nr:MAG: hypothetical protein DI532_20620 [Azospirillum brasilense]